jgi:hypothetical protein
LRLQSDGAAILSGTAVTGVTANATNSAISTVTAQSAVSPEATITVQRARQTDALAGCHGDWRPRSTISAEAANAAGTANRPGAAATKPGISAESTTLPARAKQPYGSICRRSNRNCPGSTGVATTSAIATFSSCRGRPSKSSAADTTVAACAAAALYDTVGDGYIQALHDDDSAATARATSTTGATINSGDVTRSPITASATVTAKCVND